MPWIEAHRELREKFDRKAEEAKKGPAAERIAKMLSQRRSLNDDFSFGPGVTIYLKDEAGTEGKIKENMAKVAEKYHRPQILRLLEEGATPGTYRMDLPEG